MNLQIEINKIKMRERHHSLDLEKWTVSWRDAFLKSNKGSNTIILHFREYFNKTDNPGFPFFVMNNSKMES